MADFNGSAGAPDPVAVTEAGMEKPFSAAGDLADLSAATSVAQTNALQISSIMNADDDSATSGSTTNDVPLQPVKMPLDAEAPSSISGQRRSSLAVRTKSGQLIDGTHIGVFEEDLERMKTDATAKAFDMTEFLEKLRNEDENSGSVRDVTLTWEGVTITGSGAATQEGIPVFWEPVKKIFGIPGKIAGNIKAKREAKAAAAAAANGDFAAATSGNLEKTILNDCNGFCKGGEMLLILGKPDSGASALVRALGQQGRYFKKCEGKIEMNNVDSVSWMKDYGSELFYSGDEDLHLPSLTVSQTFDYALQYREKDPVRRKEWLDWLITWLGLTKAKDTIVGDSFLRGVSGGERRRVSVGEQLAANATVNAWDQCTKGLDSTYALVVVKGLRLLTSILNKTSVCYLNQVSEGIYELFDRVCVIVGGRCIYQGPSNEAAEYFKGLGFEPLPRQSVSDFIQQCTEPKEQNVRKGFLEEKGRAPPVTAADFEAAWKASSECAKFNKELATVKEEAASRNAPGEFRDAVVKHREATTAAGPKSVYPTTVWQQFTTSFRREYTLYSGQKPLLVFKWFFNFFVAFIVSSYAFQVPNDGPGAFAKASGIFFSLLIVALNSNSDIPAILKARWGYGIESSFWFWFSLISFSLPSTLPSSHFLFFTLRPVMYKHHNGYFFHPASYYLASIAADLPIRFVYIATFTIVYYFMVGFKQTAGAFFIFLLNQYMSGVAYSSLTRLMTAISRDQNTAFALNGALIIPTIVSPSIQFPRPPE